MGQGDVTEFVSREEWAKIMGVDEVHDELNPESMAEGLDRAATVVAEWLVGEIDSDQAMTRLHDDILAPWSAPRIQWGRASVSSHGDKP